MNIWDTPGADEFGNLRELDFKGADVAVLVYAIDTESSFAKMEDIH